MPTLTSIDELPELDLFAADFATDAHAVLREARQRHWAARSFRGVEVLTYDACERLLLDDRFRPGGYRLVEFLGADAVDVLVGDGRTLTGSDGPDHVALRRAVMPWFTPRRIGDLRARTRALVDRLLDGAPEPRRCELMGHVASHLPGAVFCWMVGAPEADGDQLAAWSETILKVFNADPADGPAIKAANAELRGYVAALVDAKRTSPGDDVTTMLVEGADAGSITEADVHALLVEMLSASSDNTTHAAGLAVWLLVTHPAEWAKLRADRALVPNAVEECARFDPRVTATPEVNTDDAVVDDVALPAGTLTWMNFASAHRDPSAFPDPDTFDVARPLPKHQLTFGVGRHYCIGASLARMELQVVLEAVLDRWNEPRLDGDVGITRTFGVSVDALPIAWT